MTIGSAKIHRSFEMDEETEVTVIDRVTTIVEARAATEEEAIVPVPLMAEAFEDVLTHVALDEEFFDEDLSDELAEEVKNLLAPVPVDRDPEVFVAVTPWEKRGQEMYEQALKERAAQNPLAAQMSVKLALSFDPNNTTYRRFLDRISREVPADRGGYNAVRKKEAAHMFDRAKRAEELGRIDEAIELLEEALVRSREAIYLSRLGMILATEKNEPKRGLDLIREAARMRPHVKTYANNARRVQALIDAAGAPSGGWFARIKKHLRSGS